MEFLTMSDDIYDDNIGEGSPQITEMGKEDKSKSSISEEALLASITLRAVDTDGIEDIRDFIETLSGDKHSIMIALTKEDPSLKDKGLAMGLLNRYPDLKEDDSQREEFKSHIFKLLTSKSLSPSAVLYIIKELLGLVKSKEQEEAEEAAAQNAKEQAKEQNQEEDANLKYKKAAADLKEAEAAKIAVKLQSPNKNFSDLEDIYNDRESDLTEDQFSELINMEELEGYLNQPSLIRASSEFIKNNEEGYKKAMLLLEKKRISVWNSKFKNMKNTNYSDVDDLKISDTAINFLKDRL